MKPLISFIFTLTSFFISVSLLSTPTEAAAAIEKDGIYIVYMGAAASTKGSLRDDHAQLLTSLLKRKKNALVHSYKNGFSGFAAHLTVEEAHSISQRAGVVSVFPDPVLELQTTRSWDFLNHLTSVVMDMNPNSGSNSTSDDTDVIIGILDTGIWPESESFNDKAMGPIPSRWKGTCEKAHDFNTSNCNKKIIGARSYDKHKSYLSPRDMEGHGTHVSSTAAGSEVQGISYYGLAEGTAKGGSPGSRIAMYRVCYPDYGCRGSSILAAFNDAIADGVDVLSLSLGAPSSQRSQLKDDPISLGAFHAVQHGITVVCGAGNDGPGPGTVVNAAPWIMTVAASTIDRDFESDVVLGDKTIIKGGGINFANITKSPVYPIIHRISVAKKGADVNASRNCNPGSLDQELIKGKIVVCEDVDNFIFSQSAIQDEVKMLGGIGIVFIDDVARVSASNFGDLPMFGTFPTTVVGSDDGAKVLSYINSTKNPVATILPTTSPTKYTPAPVVAYFSSRGPSVVPKNILKPDIAAPGLNILAAWIPKDVSDAPEGKETLMYNIISGTSMACPHVSGIAATVKSRNPTWSPSAIRSAIMTTALQTNNLKAPITTEKGIRATPYDFGAGEISPTRPLQPGLVYETSVVDYLNFLCYYGYNITTIKNIANTTPDGFTCPEDSSIDLISNINYPSIAITNFDEKAGRKVNRTLTNVAGDGESVYSVSIDAPADLQVQVVPNKLQFSKNGDKSSYQVSFSTANQLKKDVFGSITWSNGKYKVRSPFAVSGKSGN